MRPWRSPAQREGGVSFAPIDPCDTHPSPRRTGLMNSLSSYLYALNCAWGNHRTMGVRGHHGVSGDWLRVRTSCVCPVMSTAPSRHTHKASQVSAPGGSGKGGHSCWWGHSPSTSSWRDSSASESRSPHGTTWWPWHSPKRNSPMVKTWANRGAGWAAGVRPVEVLSARANRPRRPGRGLLALVSGYGCSSNSPRVTCRSLHMVFR